MRRGSGGHDRTKTLTGASTFAGTGQVIKCVAPATGKVLGECRAYTPDEVKAAYDAAKKAQV